MNTIFKRLQIIQTALYLEDRTLIDSQRSAIDAELPNISNEKLRRFIESISQALANADYPLAQSRIATLLAQATTLIVREDPECGALKLQLTSLKQRWADLNQQYEDINHRINDFNRSYNLRLGDIIIKILKLRATIAHYLMFNSTDSNTEEAYANAQKMYQEFFSEHEAQCNEPAPAELNEDEQKRLKQAYRRASRLCHPDMVAEENKAQATEIFKALSTAYTKNDLAGVERILTMLQDGSSFTTSNKQVNDKAQLQKQIEALQQRITELEQEIANLQAEDIWQLIESFNDEEEYEEYFQEQEELLNTELQNLQDELNNLINQ